MKQRVSDCSGRYGCNADADKALTAAFAGSDLHVDCTHLYSCTGNFDYMVCDVFDAQDVFVGYVEVYCFDKQYDFEYFAWGEDC